MQVAEVLQMATLGLSGSDSPRLDAEILLCKALQCQRSQLYTHPEQRLSEPVLQNFRSMLSLRSSGYPVAYLTGKKEFWSLELVVNPDTFIPRPETELLVQQALERATKETSFSVLDLGTGSGAIAIAIASERPLATITAVDINKNALATARANSASYQLQNIVFKHASWFDQEHDDYDLIVSNPPYIEAHDPHLSHGDIHFEPESALISGVDGLTALKFIIANSSTYLKNKGWLLLEHGYQQGLEVRQLLALNHFSKIATLRDYSNLERVSIGQFFK